MTQRWIGVGAPPGRVVISSSAQMGPHSGRQLEGRKTRDRWFSLLGLHPDQKLN